VKGQTISFPASLPELLLQRADHQPQAVAFRFLIDGETESVCLTYAELAGQAGAAAEWLRLHTTPGDRVLLAFPAGLDFLIACFGCLLARVIPVPVAVPGRHQAPQRLLQIAADCAPSLGLTDTATRGRLPQACGPWECLDTSRATRSIAETVAVEPDSIALLQYTSGSTRLPRGVVVTHRALFDQLDYYRQRAGRNWDRMVFVGWLPHDHDFGLVGFFFSAVYLGAPCTFLSPAAFLQKPLRWLQAISRYRATYSGGPSFAYELAARARGDVPLDLSCWQIASSGGEPVSASTLHRFQTRFRAAGFRPESFLPAYGLAEAVLCVTARHGAAVCAFDASALRDRRATLLPPGSPAAASLVSCGTALPGQQVAIVDPESRTRLADDRVGEIWVTGKGLAAGYWGQVAETESTFRARLAGDSGVWLRTGDCGFLHEGELYVTGRLNDVIIVRGLNHSPEVLETTIQNVDPRLRAGCGAVVQTPDPETPGTSIVVAIQEVESIGEGDCSDLFAAIRRTVARQHGLQLDRILFIRPRSLPRTENGKICRHRCRAALEAGSLRVLATSSAELSRMDTSAVADDAERIRGLLQALLPGTQIGVNDNFFSVGGDSLTAQRFLAELRDLTGLDLPVSTLFDFPTPAGLAREVARWNAEAKSPLRSPGLPATAFPAPESLSNASLPVTQSEPGGLTELYARPEPHVTPDGAGLAAILAQLQQLTARADRQIQLLLEQNRLLTQQVALLRNAGLVGPAESTRQADATGSAESAPGASTTLIPTELQREIQFFTELYPASAAAFHSQLVLEFAAPVDVESILKAFQRLVARHDALRMAFIDGVPHIQFSVPVPLQQVSLANLETVRSWLRDERQRPFDCVTAPLWRLAVLEIPDRSFLVWTAHHLIVDGWSLHVLATEFADCYQAETVRSDVALPEAGQFAAVCTQRGLRGARSDESARFWKTLVGRQWPAVEFPGDLVRTAEHVSHAAAVVTIEIAADLRKALVDRGARQSATLFQTLLAGYFALLSQVTGQERLVIGIEMRDAAGVPEPLVGPCNTLVPIILDVPQDPTVADFLELVRHRVLACQAHHDDALAQLLHDLNVPQDPRSPFRILATMNFLRVANETVCLPRFDLEADSITHSPFGLTLDVRDGSGSLRLDFVYNTSMLEGTSVERLAARYLALLQSLAAGQSRLFAGLTLSPAERETVLTWGDGGPAQAGDRPWIDVFADVATRQGSRTAVTCGDESWTYTELDQRSSAVATMLTRQGLAAGDRVGVLVQRGCPFLAALIGVLKAGAVFLPLDPRWPAARLQHQFEQTRPRVVLTGDDADLAGSGTGPTDPVVIRLAAAMQASGPSPAAAVRMSDPAYAITTSGSTGVPKTALVAHRGLMNHLITKCSSLQLTEADRVSQTAAVTFDVSIWQCLAPLLVGGEVVVFPDEIVLDPDVLLSELERRQITVCQLVPTQLRQFVEVESNRPQRRVFCRSLRWMISIGEVLTADLARKWISLFPRTPLVNQYGPAECSDTVAQHVLIWPPRESTRVPIGRPLPGVRLSVFDSRGELVPPGTPGELAIGGDCVGLGYLNDPVRTAEAFGSDPSDLRGGRWYRTGDRVRFRSDGLLEYLGRRDRQLKVRGVRIEPGEVEAVLQKHPHVRQCVVAVREHAGVERLVAYVVLSPGTAVTPGVLRALARNTLPQALVPAQVVLLDRLPVTDSGKVDGDRLPDPDWDTPSGDPTPPETPVQEQLVRIWTDVMEQRRIGIHDDLFELGGRSLDAARIASRIGEIFNFRMPVSEVFRTPTVAGIAAYVERRRATDWREMSAATPDRKGGP